LFLQKTNKTKEQKTNHKTKTTLLKTPSINYSYTCGLDFKTCHIKFQKETFGIDVQFLIKIIFFEMLVFIAIIYVFNVVELN